MTENSILGFKGEYRWLSNFHILSSPIIIHIDGVDYKFETSENLYQASKYANKLVEIESFAIIDPAKAKALGRRPITNPKFSENKIEIMKAIQLLKFSKLPENDKLMSTKDSFIREDNTWNDTFWGFCNNVGHNHLGKCIMEVRDMYKSQRYIPGSVSQNILLDLIL